MNKNTTNKSQIREIVIPILNSEYKVIVVMGNDKDLKRVAKSWGYDDFTIPFGSRRGSTYYRADRHPIIHISKKPKTAEEMGTLAHEATHACHHVFDAIDEVDRNTEAFAHSVGAVVRGVLK